MDWTRAIERNREALKRVLATLVAMAGFGGADMRETRESTRGQFTCFRPAGASGPEMPEAETGKLSPAPTL